MKVEKLSISMDPRLGDEIRAAAGKAEVPLSTWLAEAAAARLRQEALRELLADWQAEHGPITAAELARARAELGYPERTS